jgi:hypothetical protein
MGGFVKIGNKLYTGSDSKRKLLCVDTETGMVTDSLKVGCGAILYADNLLIYYKPAG